MNRSFSMVTVRLGASTCVFFATTDLASAQSDLGVVVLAGGPCQTVDGAQAPANSSAV
jgi:hypothetical protein